MPFPGGIAPSTYINIFQKKVINKTHSKRKGKGCFQPAVQYLASSARRVLTVVSISSCSREFFL